MHTHIKLGAHALSNVNHSYHVGVDAPALILGVYAPALILGVYAPALSLGVYAPALILGVYAPALILGVYAPAFIGTTCILHSQVVVVSLHCR